MRQGSDGCDSVFEDGRVRSTLPGDMFLTGEVYGSNGRLDEGLKSSIAQITVAIQSYKWFSDNLRTSATRKTPPCISMASG